MTEARRVSSFLREAGQGFLDPKKEAFCKSWAKNGVLKTACEAADVSIPTGTKWRGNEEIERRIRELRAGSETYVGVSKAWIVNKLKANADAAAEDGQFKASNDALLALAKLLTSDKELPLNSGSHAGDLSPEELARERALLFPNPALPADTRVMVEGEDGVFSEEEREVMELEAFTPAGERFVADMAKAFDGRRFDPDTGE